MYTPYNSRHFTTYVDPESKMKIAILSTHVAPVQQSFYFVNSGWSDDGRYYWFYCSYPPSLDRVAGVVDFLIDEVFVFPETGVKSSYLVDHRNGNLYFGNGQGIYMRTPHPQDKAVLIARLPEKCRSAQVKSVATHLTLSPDESELMADIQTECGTVMGTFRISTGEFCEWYHTPLGKPYNHAQMSPVDENLCLCAHESYFDPALGKRVPPQMENGIYPRLHIIGRDGSNRMIPPFENYATHEYWAPDGKAIYYCKGGFLENGNRVGYIVKSDLSNDEAYPVYQIEIPNGVSTWHSHCSQNEKYFVADGSYPDGELRWWRGCESFVTFCNTETGKQIRFLTKNPVVEGWSPQNPCPYHIDPHPRFVLNDSLISFTTTVYGRVDAAVISVDQLIEATK